MRTFTEHEQIEMTYLSLLINDPYSNDVVEKDHGSEEDFTMLKRHIERFKK